MNLFRVGIPVVNAEALVIARQAAEVEDTEMKHHGKLLPLLSA